MKFASRRLIMLLLKGGEIFAPESMGVCDLLLSPEKILLIRQQITAVPEYETEVMDCSGLILCPAFIDQHVHLTGGGGEEGPQSRVPEMGITELINAGIGTAAGLLGADGITRSIAALLVKARALEMDGMSTVIYTGSYGLPTDTLTGRVLHDIAFIDKVVGAGEVAISDYRSSHPSLEMLRELAWEVKLGGMIGGKAGILHLHVGDGKKGLDPLTDLIEESNFPMGMFVPTHLNRNKKLFEDAIRFGQKGGFVDLTAGETDQTGHTLPEAARLLLQGGVKPAQITFSSDAGGSNPQSPDGRGHAVSLYHDVISCVHEKSIPLETTLTMVTKNPATRLKLYPQKGALAPGSDADILALQKEDLSIVHLIFKGKTAMRNGAILIKGKYEP
jgi:beta-aspartyl-dipeptidase (metallo-type)